MTETINPDKFELSINNYKFEKKKFVPYRKKRRFFMNIFNFLNSSFFSHRSAYVRNLSALFSGALMIHIWPV